MTESPPSQKSSKLAGAILVLIGTLLLVGLAAFVTIIMGYRQSFTASSPPVEDMTAGFALLSPIVLLALLLIGYGRRLLRRK